jgi:hypothetical protein
MPIVTKELPLEDSAMRGEAHVGKFGLALWTTIVQ